MSMKRPFLSRGILFLLSALFFSNLLYADDFIHVKVRKGDTISYLSFKIYGMYDERIADRLYHSGGIEEDARFRGRPDDCGCPFLFGT